MSLRVYTVCLHSEGSAGTTMVMQPGWCPNCSSHLRTRHNGSQVQDFLHVSAIEQQHGMKKMIYVNDRKHDFDLVDPELPSHRLPAGAHDKATARLKRNIQALLDRSWPRNVLLDNVAYAGNDGRLAERVTRRTFDWAARRDMSIH